VKSDINVTPFIDVLLVLLIIFMIVAPTPPRAMDTALPDRKAAGPSPDSLVLEVRGDGFALNTTPIWTTTSLREQLRAAFETRGDRTLLVKPPPPPPPPRVVEALDVAHEAGVGRIGMLDPHTEEPPN
jgi:biopolymer transport protein TolR